VSVQGIAALKGELEEVEEVWLTDGELPARARVFRWKDRTWEARSDGGWVFMDWATQLTLSKD
jgi:hypothetical protein